MEKGILEYVMPKPKLSAALNNCALHAFVPTIKAQVQALAAVPAPHNPHKAQYESLKDAFAEFYGFDKKNFSFVQFSKILNKYNAYDSQIILGPVLREFMKSTAKNVDDDDILITLAVASQKDSVDHYIQSRTEMSSHTARYESLSPQEVALLVGKPLGIDVSYSTESTINRLPSVESPIASIVMHHSGGIDGAASGGHWELTGDSNDIDRSAEKKAKLNNIASVFTEGDQSLSQCGLVLLKAHVQLSAIDATRDLKQLDNKAQDLTDALLQGSTPEPTAVAKWSLDLQTAALQRVQEKTRPEKRVLSAQERSFISASVNAQKGSLKADQTARYKAELEHLFSRRVEIQEKAASTIGKGDTLSDEELAAKLQAEEFEHAGFKP